MKKGAACAYQTRLSKKNHFEVLIWPARAAPFIVPLGL
jgi:hypothetical protein